MNNSFSTTVGVVSTISAIIGIVFFFINPIVTIVCGCITILNSLVQITFGGQNNIATEIITALIGLIVSLFVGSPIFLTICFALCIGDAVISTLGYVMLLFMR